LFLELIVFLPATICWSANDFVNFLQVNSFPLSQMTALSNLIGTNVDEDLDDSGVEQRGEIPLSRQESAMSNISGLSKIPGLSKVSDLDDMIEITEEMATDSFVSKAMPLNDSSRQTSFLSYIRNLNVDALCALVQQCRSALCEN
jgi:hypothetical protein